MTRNSSRVPLGEGLTHLNWKKEEIPALVDREIIRDIPRVTAKDSSVQTALNHIRGGIQNEPVTPYIEEKLRGDGLIIGFSGYASDGFGYEAEAGGIKQVIQTFKERVTPIDLVVDGGTSLGVPGLSGLLSEQEGIETLGCVPLEGLRSAGPRDATIVLGE